MLFTYTTKARPASPLVLFRKKLITLFVVLSLSTLPLHAFALDSTGVPTLATFPMPSVLSPKCSFNYTDTYDGTMMPQGPLATISTTAGSATQLKFFNNGTPNQTIAVNCTGYYQIFFSIELQANTNVPLINITNISASPVFPKAGGANSYVIYPQCNNVVLGYTTVPPDTAFNQTLAYLYYDTTQSPNIVVLAYKDTNNNINRITIPPASNLYASIVGVLSSGSQVLTDAELSALYKTALTLVPQPNTPMQPFCVVQTISESVTANLTTGDTINAPSFTTDSSVSVLGGEFSVNYLGPCLDDHGNTLSPKPYYCP